MTAYDFYKNILHMTDEKIIQALLRRTEIRHGESWNIYRESGRDAELYGVFDPRHFERILY